MPHQNNIMISENSRGRTYAKCISKMSFMASLTLLLCHFLIAWGDDIDLTKILNDACWMITTRFVLKLHVTWSSYKVSFFFLIEQSSTTFLDALYSWLKINKNIFVMRKRMTNSFWTVWQWLFCNGSLCLLF